MVNLRGLGFSGNKATLLQRLMEDDNERKNNNNSKDNSASGQTTEDSIQEIQQAGPPDILKENNCPICYSETEEDSRIHMFRCCGNWICIACCNKWINEPRCMICNINKTEDRLARATVTLLD